MGCMGGERNARLDSYEPSLGSASRTWQATLFQDCSGWAPFRGWFDTWLDSSFRAVCILLIHALQVFGTSAFKVDSRDSFWSKYRQS